MDRRLATLSSPALVVYLLDVSASMDRLLGTRTRLELALETLRETLASLLVPAVQDRSGPLRYLIGLYAYGTEEEGTCMLFPGHTRAFLRLGLQTSVAAGRVEPRVR